MASCLAVGITQDDGTTRLKLAIPDAARPVAGIPLTCLCAVPEASLDDAGESMSARVAQSSGLTLEFKVVLHPDSLLQPARPI